MGEAVVADNSGLTSWLVCKVGVRLCALPLQSIVETMRPLPVERLAHAPPFVSGLSIVRGAPTPVVDAGALLGGADGKTRRLVTIRTGDRIVALGVDSVIGIRSLAPSLSTALPPLLREANGDIVAAIGTLDSEFLLFLQTTRLIPDELAKDLTLKGASA